MNKQLKRESLKTCIHLVSDVLKLPLSEWNYRWSFVIFCLSLGVHVSKDQTVGTVCTFTVRSHISFPTGILTEEFYLDLPSISWWECSIPTLP